MKVYLIVATGPHQGVPVLIKVDLFLMGSDRICQLRSQLPGIVPQHCALNVRSKKVFVRNLGLPAWGVGEIRNQGHFRLDAAQAAPS